MNIAVLGPLVLSANFGLADDDGEVDADLGRGGSMKLKFTNLEELRQWVERCGAQPQAPTEDLAEVAADSRNGLRESDDGVRAARCSSSAGTYRQAAKSRRDRSDFGPESRLGCVIRRPPRARRRRVAQQRLGPGNWPQPTLRKTSGAALAL